jgi:two-component system chemotaxis response regulator CheY
MLVCQIATVVSFGATMPRVLIVDDALIMRRLIADVARQAGWEVAGEASNGQDAVEQFRTLRPDLTTLDMVMPLMGGLEALRQIRAIDPEARVVMVTAVDQREALLESIREGALDFVVKPFDRDRILGVLQKVQAALNATAHSGPATPDTTEAHGEPR